MPTYDLVTRIINAGAAIVVLAFILSALSIVDAQATGMRVDDVVIEAANGPHKIQAEIADTPVLRARGLMFRRSLEPGKGMLFLNAEPVEISMWMKNTYISLDMIFIAPDGRIVRIAEETEPFSLKHIDSGGKVLGVLEVAAGSARRLGLKRGDMVRHPHFSAKN